MNVQEQIKKYITSQPEPKRTDMRELHRLTLQVSPECKLWFFDGKDSTNHTVSNPTIGYGFHTIKYANGKSREFFQIGVSGNKTGISVYILGLKDKKYLAKTYGKKLGKASVTGYCIRFRALKDINIDTLEAAIRYGLRRVSTTLRQVFAKFSEFFMCWGFPQKNFAPGSPGSDDLQLGRPAVSPLLSFFKRISHFQSSSLRSAVPEQAC